MIFIMLTEDMEKYALRFTSEDVQSLGKICTKIHLYRILVKPVHVVTSVKQSPVLKKSPFSFPVIENFI
jgi:hypothetical protein